MLLPSVSPQSDTTNTELPNYFIKQRLPGSKQFLFWPFNHRIRFFLLLLWNKLIPQISGEKHFWGRRLFLFPCHVNCEPFTAYLGSYWKFGLINSWPQQTFPSESSVRTQCNTNGKTSRKFCWRKKADEKISIAFLTHTQMHLFITKKYIKLWKEKKKGKLKMMSVHVDDALGHFNLLAKICWVLWSYCVYSCCSIKNN